MCGQTLAAERVGEPGTQRLRSMLGPGVLSLPPPPSISLYSLEMANKTRLQYWKLDKPSVKKDSESFPPLSMWSLFLLLPAFLPFCYILHTLVTQNARYRSTDTTVVIMKTDMGNWPLLTEGYYKNMKTGKVISVEGSWGSACMLLNKPVDLFE